METVTPWQYTDAEAAVAVRDYITAHPGADATDVAEALRLPVLRAFEVCDALVASGEIEGAEVERMEPIHVTVSDTVIRQHRENPPSNDPPPCGGLMAWFDVLEREEAEGQ